MQRPLHQLLSRTQGAGDERSLAAFATDYSTDEFWGKILAAPGERRALVLAVDPERLMNRVRRRRTIEGDDEAYDVETWFERYAAIDLVALYRAWLGELEAQRIPAIFVDARDDEYRLLSDEGELIALVEGAGAGWTRESIEERLSREHFEYHRVFLPFGLKTTELDRSQTRDIVLPASLEGKSVLDVGSALGYFCFAAEARDARRVVGYEPKPTRYRQACLLKSMKGSRVDFQQRDVSADPIDESWDLILLLNVIHHLKDPMRVIHNLVRFARERVVIEFPTFADPRYKRHRRILWPGLYNRRPLIGVSSIVKGVAQTFVFSPEAMRAMLMEQGTSIRSLELVPSPITGRMIALVDK